MWLYAAAVSLVAAILTVYDKVAARRQGRRVPEKTLLLIGLLGGAAAEWLIMRLIRHKTRHARFMIGLPLMTVVHLLLIGGLILVRIFG